MGSSDSMFVSLLCLQMKGTVISVQSITFDTRDASMFGNDLYCRSPEALETVLAKLREIGYEVKDLRLDERHLKVTGATPRQMEEQGACLQIANLDVYRGKCGSCQQHIETRGIQSHGHTCELCGEVTYLDIPDGAVLRLRFLDGDTRSIFNQLEMRVVHWDYDGGWLYLEPEPLLDSEGYSVLTAKDAALNYLNDNRDKWELADYDGRLALKMRYVKQGGPEDRSGNAIDTYAVFYSYRNFKLVRVWEGVEYPEYGPDFPMIETLYIYELWHMAEQPQV